MELKEFGAFIGKHRIEKGYKSQRQLALAAGLSTSTILRIEDGSQRATPETLEKIAPLLEMSYEELLRFAGYLPAEKKQVDILEAIEDINIELTAGGRPLTPEERVEILKIIDKSHDKIGINTHAQEGDMVYNVNNGTKKLVNMDSGKDMSVSGINIHDLSNAPIKSTGTDVIYDIDKELDRAVIAASHQGKEIMRPVPPGLRDLIKRVVIEILEEREEKRKR